MRPDGTLGRVPLVMLTPRSLDEENFMAARAAPTFFFLFVCFCVKDQVCMALVRRAVLRQAHILK